MSAAPKCQIACSYCRGRKVRCTGGVRCQNCIDHGKECVYPPPQRKKRRKDGPENILLERRLAQVEALLQLPKGQELAESVQNPAPYEPPQGSPSEMMRKHSMQPADRPRQISNAHISPTNTYTGPGYDDDGRLEEASNTLASLRAAQSPHNNFCRAQSTTDSSALTSDYFRGESTNTTPQTHIDQEENIISPYNVNWEHHGPGSWLSICSCRGIQWVTERTGVPDFARIARSLTMGFTKRLKLDSSTCRDRAPELDPETAWRYASAYFEECHYAIFGVVHRPAFETRLRAQFANPSEFQDDPSWFALRNAVYASGCRVVLSKDHTKTFNEAQAESWKYFENALSMHTELIYTPTGLTAVQALTLMSFYCEGLGSPVLEYMLCSNAARLAQSKGLHRQAAKAWSLPESEILHRNWLFWAIYCCEKAIAARSGRPSGIDDDNISCVIPTAIVSDSTIDIELFTHAIQHAQISSEISKRLVSVSAFRRTPLELIEKVSSIHRSLEQWRAQLPLHLQPGTLRNPLKLSNAKNNINFTYIHLAYYGSLMAIHTVFTYPWITAMFGPAPTPATRDQVSLSTSIVAEAARNIILTTRYIDMDAASPAWLSFYFPMVGLINLFVSILKYPHGAAAQSDVALLDSAAGHFGHMEFITANEQAFPFTREVAALARVTVLKARDAGGAVREGENWTGVRDERAEVGSRSGMGNRTGTGTNGSEDASTVREASMSANMEVDPWNDLDVLSAIDFDMESWNVFSSVPMDDMAGGGHEVSMFGKGLSYPTN